MNMKRTLTGAVLSLALILSLCACSTGSRDDNAANTDQPSASPSQSVTPTDPGNDAMNGGGAGGTNDVDNDGMPDVNGGSDGANGINGGTNGADSGLNDGMNGADADGDDGSLGDMVGNAGRSIRQAGDDLGNAAKNAGRAITGSR